jgi:cell division protein FtsB
VGRLAAVHRLKKAILPGLLLLAAYYAVFGGEYSWFELRDVRAAVGEEEADLAELRRQIDSLRAWADSMRIDSVTLERIARERFGMIRDGETLYRFAQPEDSTLALTDTTTGPPR